MDNEYNAYRDEGDDDLSDKSLSPEVQRIIDNWRPQKVKPEQRVFLPEVLPIVRDCVANARPISPVDARHFLWATCQLMLWAYEEFGYIDTEEVLTFHNVNCFIECKSDNEDDGWLREIRSLLSRVARAVNPDGFPQKPPSYGMSSIALPYSTDEEEMWSFVASSSEASNRASRLAIVAFSFGAGIRGGEIALVVPSDLDYRDDGRIVLNVPGKWSRRVPIRAAYSDLVRQAVEASDGAKFLKSSGDAAASLIASRLIENPDVTGRRNGLSLRRARNTWVAAYMRVDFPLWALRVLAGQLSAKTLDGLVDRICAEHDPEDAVEAGLRI